MNPQTILVGCEVSGVVRDALRRRGHNAFSCDLLPNDSPFHIQGDVFEAIESRHWDALIVFPTCTFLTVSGLHWNKRGKIESDGRPRAEHTEDALDFVRRLLDCGIEKILLENPVGCISTRIRPPDQIVQPYWFGADASKKTCFWLKGLPLLTSKPEDFVEPRLVCCGMVLEDGLGKYGCPNCCGDNVAKPRWANQTGSGQNKLGPSADRAALRGYTYPGIAEAIAALFPDVSA